MSELGLQKGGCSRTAERSHKKGRRLGTTGPKEGRRDATSGMCTAEEEEEDGAVLVLGVVLMMGAGGRRVSRRVTGVPCISI